MLPSLKGLAVPEEVALCEEIAEGPSLPLFRWWEESFGKLALVLLGHLSFARKGIRSQDLRSSSHLVVRSLATSLDMFKVVPSWDSGFIVGVATGMLHPFAHWDSFW